MINDIKEYFRFKLYENSRVLVNNLNDVIEELKLFLDKKIYPYVTNNEERIVISDIEITYENEKVVWRIVEKDEINIQSTLKLDIYNIKETFIDIEYIKEIKELKEDYPKDLCGFSLISFMDTISYFVYSNELIGEPIDVFNICMLSDNGNNNVVYEMQ
jgi:hypothetical protein